MKHLSFGKYDQYKLASPHGGDDTEPTRWCENCGREMDSYKYGRFCSACWCPICDRDAGECVGFCDVDGHTDEHLTDELICARCEEEQESAADRMAEQINLCGQMLRDGGAR